jgi:hypothetical protein
MLSIACHCDTELPSLARNRRYIPYSVYVMENCLQVLRDVESGRNLGALQACIAGESETFSCNTDFLESDLLWFSSVPLGLELHLSEVTTQSFKFISIHLSLDNSEAISMYRKRFK